MNVKKKTLDGQERNEFTEETLTRLASEPMDGQRDDRKQVREGKLKEGFQRLRGRKRRSGSRS